jgi:hypothetical protein
MLALDSALFSGERGSPETLAETMKRKPITAGELVAELAADPLYQRKMADREARIAPIIERHRKDEASLVAEIRALGYAIGSVSDFVNTSEEYPEAVSILIRHLDVTHEPKVRESIIRALTIKYGGTPLENALLTHFQRERDPNLRWALANALKTAMPLSRRKRHPEIEVTYRGHRREKAANQASQPTRSARG